MPGFNTGPGKRNAAPAKWPLIPTHNSMKKNAPDQVIKYTEPQACINKLLTRIPAWLAVDDSGADIILSTRIRLARNLSAFAFPSKAGASTLQQVIDAAVAACPKLGMLKNAFVLNMTELDEIAEKMLVERRLVSPAFVEASHPRVAIIDPDEFFSIMINEEDHLRIQSLQPGLALQEAWRQISVLDDELSDQLEFAYSSHFGYLTACPTNTGTGMRASLLVHVPGLSIDQDTHKLMKKLATKEITVRGFYGEGSDAMGNIFQISNQLTLGRTESSILKKLEEMAQKIVEAEQEARERLLFKQRTLTEDKVFRALGLLQHARVMSSAELLNHLSMVKLGVELRVLPAAKASFINELILMTQPAHMQTLQGHKADSAHRDAMRARIVRERFAHASR